MRKNETQDIKSIIKDVLRQNHLDGRFYEQEVIDAWPEIVGSMFAKYTRKVVLRNKLLYVTLNSSSARQELVMAKSHLLKNISDKFGSDMVKDIIFY